MEVKREKAEVKNSFIKPVLNISWDWLMWWETIKDCKVYYPVALSFRVVEKEEYKSPIVILNLFWLQIIIGYMKIYQKPITINK